MNKWTPGPWQAIGTDPAEGGDWFWIKAQPNPMLRGFTTEIGIVSGPQGDHRQQANAALIAAAPDLAEALARTIPFLSAFRGGADSLLKDVHAALAKARGE